MTSKISTDEKKDAHTGGHAITVGNMHRSVAAIGAGAQVVYTNIERALTEVEIAEQAEAFERKRLAEAVTAHVERLQRQVEQAYHRSSQGNPYKALLEYDLGDTALFHGRAEAIDALRVCLERSPLTVLHADSGMGKTSLLKAGLAPRVLADGHVPLYVRPYNTSVTSAVKHALITELEPTPRLAAASLRDFLRRATDLLGGQHLVVMLDQFEEFFSVQTPDARADFIGELAACLDDDLLPVRWIVALRSEWFGHLSTFQPQVRQPFANQYLLSALSRDEARDAIILPEQSSNLDYAPELLEVLIDDLGPESIAPPQLQIVCHTLAESLSPGEKRLTLAAYERLGRADGILRNYLDGVLARNLSPGDRTPAWQLLAAMVDRGSGHATEAELVDHVKTYAVSAGDARRVLKLLETNRLVRPSDGRYRLSSDRLRPRIRQWAAERAAIELARAEAARQIERIRNSALRGMLGGALGFCMAYVLAFGSQMNDQSLLVFRTAIRALPGAVAGLLLIFMVDVALASYRGPRQWMCWLVGGLAGAGSFALAVMSHAMWLWPYDVQPVLRAGVEGALWGASAGVGTVWVMSDHHSPGHRLVKVIVVAVAGGLVLGLADTGIIGDAFGNPPSTLLVGAAGAAMPLCLLAVALLASVRRKEAAL